MLSGERVGLRAREQADVAVLHSELYEDVAGRSQADTRAWRPIPIGPGSPYAVREPSDQTAEFSVVELATGELAGAPGDVRFHLRCGDHLIATLV